jgi:citrate lyase gamma subunit
MEMSKILDVNQSYTFSQIFELKIEPDDLAAEFGYTFQRTRLNLLQYVGALSRLEDLRSRLEAVMPYVSLTNETSRREVLVSQVILEVVQQTKAQLKIEYPIKVTEQLKGILDYLLKSQTELLVIEAKREDLDYGFTQLVAEMIALDQWDRSPDQPQLLGAVTTGQIWRFGLLDRATKHIEQGLDLYRVPDDLDIVVRILIQALVP